MIRFIRVVGNSMSPVLMPEDYVIITSRPVRKSRLKQGDICVFKTKCYGTMIKRIISCNNKLKVALFEGESPMSVTTEEIGDIPYDAIKGVVIRHIQKK